MTNDKQPVLKADEDLPFVTHEGVVKLGDLEIKVLRLSNGESVIEADSFHALMDALFSERGEATNDPP